MVWRGSGVILGFPFLSRCFFSSTVVLVFVGHSDEPLKGKLLLIMFTRTKTTSVRSERRQYTEFTQAQYVSPQCGDGIELFFGITVWLKYSLILLSRASRIFHRFSEIKSRESKLLLKNILQKSYSFSLHC